jgi:imidazoleglycerol phosphate dehydratase HisB
LLFGLFLEVRVGEEKRVTKETNVSVKINLDGSGVADSSTGIPFLDHMLDVSTFSLNDLLLLFVVDFDFCYVIIF